jgi:hypothetical protein
MFTAEEKAQDKARGQRAAEKQQRDAARRAKAPTKSGDPLTVTYPSSGARGPVTRTEEFKTERSASMWYVDQKTQDARMQVNVDRDPSNYRAPDDHSSAYAVIEQALAEKAGSSPSAVREALAKKVAAKQVKYDKEVAKFNEERAKYS